VKQPVYTYDELDEILRGNGRSGNVGISAIEGMIAALVAGPAFVHPEEWLPIIFAGRVPDVHEGTPEHLAVNTIFNRYNEVSLTLAHNPQAYRLMFMNQQGHVIVSDWAAGFMLIVAKRPNAWTKILLTDTRKALAPIFASHELGVGFLLDIPKAEFDNLRAVAHYYVADAVAALREACAAATHRSRRNPPKPTRVSSSPKGWSPPTRRVTRAPHCRSSASTARSNGAPASSASSQSRDKSGPLGRSSSSSMTNGRSNELVT
jgi:uncharacterized protein